MSQKQLVFTYIFIILAVLFCVSAHVHENSNIRIQTLPAYIVASVADLINSTKCGKELQNFRDAVDQRISWSLKVLDSSGDYKSGFLYGNTYWLGSHSQCLDTMNTAPFQISKISNSTIYRDPQKEFPPFKINYFVAHLRHNTYKYRPNIFNEDVISLGLCLPASCTINELVYILEKIFHDKIILIDDLYSVDFQLIQVKDLKGNNVWSSNASFIVCIALTFSFFMTSIGTIYDIFIHQKCIKKNETNKVNINVSKDIKTEINLSSHRKNMIGRILRCFSIYTNTKKIFNTELDTDAISAFHGIRFLYMCYVIMLHTFAFTIYSFDNKVWIWKEFYRAGNFLTAFIDITVDPFFFMSGSLVTYLYLRNKENKEQIKSIDFREKLIELFVHVIKRFIRLTPAYMMTLGIFQLSSAWFDKTSQFYMSEKSHEICAKYWWRNLMYINNFFSYDAMCVTWSWYLATDMQFYIISMMLLILSTTYFYTAVTILGTILISSIILRGYSAYVYEFPIYLGLDEHTKELLDTFYFLPWYRICPYIIGIIVGYILVKEKNDSILIKNNRVFYISSIRITKKSITLCWCLASIYYTFLVVFYEHMSTLTTAVFMALHKLLCVIPIAWITITSFTNREGIINKFLSFKGWIPLSKITYCAYLLNPIIIQSISLYSETPVHFGVLHIIIIGTGYIAITYVCSYILSVMVEIPYILLMQMFIQYYNQNKKLDKKTS